MVDKRGEKLKKVLIRAPILSKSGYGVHSRQLFQYLLGKTNIDVHTQVVPWGITPWCVNHESFGGLAGEAIKRTTNEVGEYDVSFQIQLPNEWDPSLARYNVGVTAGVETDKCNPMWTSVHCAKMNQVIVPSNHTRKTFIDSGVTQTPIDIVPESYFPELVLSKPQDLGLNLETSFNFLTVGVLTGLTPETDRKNLFFLIKWFIEEFKHDSDVGLIVKTNRGRETKIDRSITEKMLRQVLSECGHDGTPKIYFLHGDMTRAEMNSLYRSRDVKALVSATRGEGFGLPLLEASVAELPVIATNWSAHTEFLDQGKWVKLAHDMVEIPASRVDDNIFMAGSRWADVTESSFKKTLRKFRQKPEMPQKWAENLSKVLTETHSTSSIAEKYDSVLGDILR